MMSLEASRKRAKSCASRPAWIKLLNFLETEDTLEQVSGKRAFSREIVTAMPIVTTVKFLFFNVGYVFFSYADLSTNLAAKEYK